MYLTEDINDICFWDTETRALPDLEDPRWGDVRESGAGRYSRSSKVIIFTYAIGEGEIKDWVLEDFDGFLRWRDCPPDLAAFIARVQNGEAWFMALNSAFDRNVCNHGMLKDRDGPMLEVEHVLDLSVQAAQSNLPQNLEGVSRAVGGPGKLPDGKRLIEMFCGADGATPQTEPEEWQTFRDYAKIDVEELRRGYISTLPVPASTWREFWASEHINDRGLPIDRDFVEAAASIAEVYSERTGERMKEISGGDLYSIKQHVAIADWVYDRVGAIEGAREIMVKRYEEDAEGGELLPAKLGLDRKRIERMIPLLERVNDEDGLTDEEYDVLQIIRMKQYGAGSSAQKYAKAIPMILDDECLPGQYIFNGAQQTGRFSSRGVQMHNLVRAAMKNEEELIEIILQACDELAPYAVYDILDAEGDVGEILSKLVRPMVAAKKGKTLVWGDWSNIEARVLPWLAKAEKRLDIFREVDANPKAPDIYVISAAGMENKPVDEYWHAYKVEEAKWAKDGRQKGKVAELSLGFGGASGALLNMAANYGLAFTEEEAAKIVKDWRAANQWAKDFWDECWEAFCGALQNPGMPFTAGRVVYLGVEGYLGQMTVLCYLPDGRPLCYRNVKYETRMVEDAKTGEMVEKTGYTFAGNHGRKGLWYGTLVENITQAAAASLLRAALPVLEYDWYSTLTPVGHTHDEIITMCDDDEKSIARAKSVLHKTMTTHYDWTEGLPLAADVETGWWYTKNV